MDSRPSSWTRSSPHFGPSGGRPSALERETLRPTTNGIEPGHWVGFEVGSLFLALTYVDWFNNRRLHEISPIQRCRATAAHVCALYPFHADEGLGPHGIYLGEDVSAGGSSWHYAVFQLGAEPADTGEQRLVEAERGQGADAVGVIDELFTDDDDGVHHGVPGDAVDDRHPV